MPRGYPIVLDVTQRLAVIVGGGAVAARKAAALIDAGATCIRVVAPNITGDFDARIDRIHRPYTPEHLEGAALVFAATDDTAVNDAVVRDAQSRGMLVNRADGHDADNGPGGDFVTPARLRDDDVTVAITAGSAALSAYIRDRVADRWDARWSLMARAMRSLRREILAIGSAEQRRAIFHTLASDEAIELLAREGESALRRWINQKFPALRETA